MISLAQSISQKAIPASTRVPVAPLDLDRVDVDDEREQRDGRPVEQARRAQQVLASRVNDVTFAIDAAPPVG